MRDNIIMPHVHRRRLQNILSVKNANATGRGTHARAIRPHCYAGRVTSCVAHVEPRRRALPELAHAEADTATSRAADVACARRSCAESRVEPGRLRVEFGSASKPSYSNGGSTHLSTRVRPLLYPEAPRAELVECKVCPHGQHVDLARHRRGPSRYVRHHLPVKLRRQHRRRRVASQAR
jgi:hypothetical protein